MGNVRYYCFSSLVIPKNRSHVVDRALLVLGSAHLSLTVDGSIRSLWSWEEFKDSSKFKALVRF